MPHCIGSAPLLFTAIVKRSEFVHPSAAIFKGGDLKGGVMARRVYFVTLRQVVVIPRQAQSPYSGVCCSAAFDCTVGLEAEETAFERVNLFQIDAALEPGNQETQGDGRACWRDVLAS